MQSCLCGLCWCAHIYGEKGSSHTLINCESHWLQHHSTTISSKQQTCHPQCPSKTQATLSPTGGSTTLHTHPRPRSTTGNAAFSILHRVVHRHVIVIVILLQLLTSLTIRAHHRPYFCSRYWNLIELIITQRGFVQQLLFMGLCKVRESAAGRPTVLFVQVSSASPPNPNPFLAAPH